jgi:UDP-glucuronate decarboxylase
MTIYGQGEQTRSFCYVDDMIEGFVRLMNTPSDVTGPINLGNPQEFSIRDLAKMIIEMTGSKAKLDFRPLPDDDPRQRKPDISKAQKTMDWRPQVALKDGLVKTIEYFEQLLRKGAI